MSENIKNKKWKPDKFFQYRRKKMTGKEMNEFERHLQKDPFAEEAAEGFENTDPEQAERDLVMLQKQIEKRTRTQRVPWFSIAASVAVLAVIVSVLVITYRKEPAQIAYAPVQNKVEETEPVIREKAPIPPKEENRSGSEIIEQTPEKEATPNKKGEAYPVPDEIAEAVTEEKDLRTDVIHAEAMKMANESLPVTARAKSPVIRKTIMDETVDSTTDLRSDSSVSELNEIVVVGYGAAEKENQEDDFSHTPPMPKIGKAEFDKYITANIHRPDSASSGQRVVVVLGFIVRDNGKIDSIRVVRSPGKSFSDEAIRLVREGPEWNPALENGSPVSENVRIRIIFK